MDHTRNVNGSPRRLTLPDALRIPFRSRRGTFPAVLLPVLIVAGMLVSSPASFSAGGLYEVREIKPGIFVWIPEDVLDQDGDPEFSRAGNAAFIITNDGVVVVDSTNSPFHAREVLYEIRRRTEAPVRYVINTSSDGERMLGNEAFADLKASIISTSRAKTEMQRYRQQIAHRLEGDDWRLRSRMRGFHIILPEQTFDSQMTLNVGGQEFRLSADLLKPGSPQSDAVVFLPAQKIVFMGELFENGFFPRLGERNLQRWSDTLQQVASWDAEIYVPGHGAPGGKKELGEFRAYLDWLSTETQRRVKEGQTLAQVKKELQPAEIFHYRAPELAPENVEAAYRQFSSQLPTMSSAATSH
jgi:glyoxylase-like metal-dependent hydrolase (beta-lactamase superfamily II)